MTVLVNQGTFSGFGAGFLYQLVVALPQQSPWILFGEQMLEAFLSHKLPEASVRRHNSGVFCDPCKAVLESAPARPRRLAKLPLASPGWIDEA